MIDLGRKARRRPSVDRRRYTAFRLVPAGAGANRAAAVAHGEPRRGRPHV